jgi:hypothetical protein
MEIVLPDIDQPPAPVAGQASQEAFVPESAPGTPLPEDRAITDEAPAASPAAPAPGGGPPAAEPTKLSRTANQNRFDKLTAEMYRLKGENDALRRIAESPLSARDKQPAAQAPAAEGPPPQPERKNYATAEEYYDARADWRTDTRLWHAASAAARVTEQRTVQANARAQAQTLANAVSDVQTKLSTEMQRGLEMFPDFVDVVSNADGDLPLQVQAVMSRSDNIPGVAYYLAKHPGVVPQLAQLPLDQLGIQISRIANATKPAATPSVTAAPPPGKPSGTRGRASPAYREDFSPEEHIAWERANGLRK